MQLTDELIAAVEVEERWLPRIGFRPRLRTATRLMVNCNARLFYLNGSRFGYMLALAGTRLGIVILMTIGFAPGGTRAGRG
jgi:hypothetical protein